MQEWNDNEIDDLMRKATKQRQILMDENAWALMQQKLRAEQRKPKFWKIWAWLMGLVLLGALVGGLWVNQFTPAENGLVILETDKAKTFQNPDSNNLVFDYQKEIAKTKWSENNPIYVEKLWDKNTIKTELEVAKRQNATSSSTSYDTLRNENKGKKRQKENLMQEIKDSRQMIVDSITQKIDAIALERKNMKFVSQPISPIFSKDLETVLLDSLFPKELAYTPEPKQKSKNAPWALLFSFSPDWSDAKLPAPKQFGALIGLQVEYQVAKKWSIRTGLQYSFKKYTADSQEYKPYEGYWQNFPRPNYIDADCNVLEFPIQVRYDFMANNQAKWFVSTGISSYWMLNERYRYVYDYNDWEQSFFNQNKHFFSIQTFSIGLEKSLNQSFKWQIEPFVKIPLSDIGFGNVRLWSSGVMLSLKYQFKHKTN